MSYLPKVPLTIYIILVICTELLYLTSTSKLFWSMHHCQPLTFLKIIKLSFKLNWKLDRKCCCESSEQLWNTYNRPQITCNLWTVFGSHCPRPCCQSSLHVTGQDYFQPLSHLLIQWSNLKPCLSDTALTDTPLFTLSLEKCD